MIQAGHAELQPLQLLVVRHGRTVLLHHLHPAQTFQLDGRRKPAFEVLYLALEVLDEVSRAPLLVGLVGVVMEHQLHELAFGQNRREPRHGDDEEAFVQRAQALEQPPPFFIDCGRYRIGKVRKARIAVARCRPAHCINVNHPAVAERRKRLVDAERDKLALRFGSTRVVGPAIEPRRHERAVLADNHAVINDSSVIEQIGQARVLRAMLCSRRSAFARNTSENKATSSTAPSTAIAMVITWSICIASLGRPCCCGTASREAGSTACTACCAGKRTASWDRLSPSF